MLSTNNYDDASDGIDVTKVGNDGERSSGKRKRSVVSSSSPSKSASPQKICPKKRKLSNVIDRLRAATDTPPVVKRRASAPRKRKLSDSFDADLQQSMLGDRGFSTEADSTKPPTYFDKLPQRQPFDDINTSRMDNVFRASCFKNAVCTITTNLKININHFTNLIGGQLTSTLPGNRLVLVINGQRYSVICYNTGRFVLTNLFFFNRLKDIYDFFINFCLLLLKRGIATLTAVDGTREGPERRFRILFLVENCQFSFRFKDEVFQKRYNQAANSQGYALNNNALVYDIPPKDVLLHLLGFLRQELGQRNHDILESSCQELGSQDKSEAFPADLIRISIRRDGTHLRRYKSPASTKRNKHNFNRQNISLLIFGNGKVIITGMATRPDLNPFFDLLGAVCKFFLSSTTPALFFCV